MKFPKCHTEAIKTATECMPHWSNKYKLMFHMYNPNGVLERRNRSDDRIRALVESGFTNSGALYVHGSFNDYHYSKLVELSYAARVSTFDLNYHVIELEHEIAAANAFIDSIAARI